jgi:hypothetical protein
MVVNIRAVRKDGVVARAAFAATDQELNRTESAYNLRRERSIDLSGRCSQEKECRVGDG